MSHINDYYSPHTGEHIATSDPAPWMKRAGVAAPEYDAKTQGCFWRGGPEWVVEDVVPAPEPEPEPQPPSYPRFSALEMLDLFTESEQLAVVEATMSVPAVKLWYDRMIAATFVTYEDPRTEGGLQSLVNAGLLDPERKTEIVSAMQPESP